MEAKTKGYLVYFCGLLVLMAVSGILRIEFLFMVFGLVLFASIFGVITFESTRKKAEPAD